MEYRRSLASSFFFKFYLSVSQQLSNNKVGKICNLGSVNLSSQTDNVSIHFEFFISSAQGCNGSTGFAETLTQNDVSSKF